MSEKNTFQKKIDLDTMYETERKFIPLFPEEITSFKNHESSVAIEQAYLSTPDEPYSLRLRSTTNEVGTEYEATVKDRGAVRADGIHRLEVTTPISRDLYNYYVNENLPKIHKIRAEPIPEVTIDFYEDGTIQIESENEAQWSHFVCRYGVAVKEITGLTESDNEQRAYQGLQFEVPRDVSVDDIFLEVVEGIGAQPGPVSVHIGGRSGSGKSTIVCELVRKLTALGVSSEVLSTDDYHRGETWLRTHNNGRPWQRWDDPIVYDTEAMAADLHRLHQGEAIERRRINWRTVEPQFVSTVLPASVLIIEGIYALAPEITGQNAIIKELPTPLATCVGRRLLRDIEERPQFADPVKSLSYMLSDVEPAYRNQRASRTIQ